MSQIKKILIVDDSFNNLVLLEDLLTEMDYEVTVANNGLEAMQLLTKYTPDLLLLDIMMPQMGGFELMEKMQEEDIQIPVIFITAKNNEEERQKAAELGAADFISKPVMISDILNKVETVIARSA